MEKKNKKKKMTQTEIKRKMRAFKIVHRFINYEAFYISPHNVLSIMAQEMIDGGITAEEFKGAIIGITRLMDSITEEAEDEYFMNAWKEISTSKNKEAFANPFVRWYNTISFPSISGLKEGMEKESNWKN
jgi:hypothetical protein